jgi:transposase-like protein
VWILLVGVVIVTIPIVLAARTVARVVRRLGRTDAAAIAKWVEKKSDDDLRALAGAVHRDAEGSIADRLLSAATDDQKTTPVAKQLALAEAVSEVEREVVDDVRVPRVAASLATTSGLLAAALVMREGLGSGYEGTGPEVTAHFQTIIERGLTLAAIAVLGGIVCASLHRTAQKQRRERLDEVDALAKPLAARLGMAEP